MEKRTQEEILRQIEGLEKNRSYLPEFSMFGDANWQQFDAQIAVLKGEKKPDDFWSDETSEEYEHQDGDNDVWAAAEEAEQWMLGLNKDDLFDPEDWE